jgi:predicted dehydrogenase
MKKTVKFGLIGCGNIALGKHYNAFKKYTRSRISLRL